MDIKIKDLIKDNTVNFLEYRKGFLWYYINYKIGTETSASFSYSGETERPIFQKYKFPVEISDCGDATFPAADKAIYFMRYINKAMKEGTLVQY